MSFGRMLTAVPLAAQLPLTCTREGSCCRRKAVWVNPWELAKMADFSGESAQSVRDARLLGGIRLRHQADGACTFLGADQGCTIHPGRPLACRLFPLGRERHGEQVRYVHEGRALPCLESCPGVSALPRLTVEAYLAGQDTAAGALAQDRYLDVAADLAEGAFVLLFDSGLAAVAGRATVEAWAAAGKRPFEQRAALLAGPWLDALTIPAIDHPLADPAGWIAAHHAQLQATAQASFASLRSADELQRASVRMLDLALHTIAAIGGDPAAAAQRWVTAARDRIRM